VVTHLGARQKKRGYRYYSSYGKYGYYYGDDGTKKRRQ